MIIPNKTLKSGFSMPVYGIGTWYMGGSLVSDTKNDKQEIQAIEAAINLGITHIDTAELYGNGHAEELVGKAIKNFNRHNLFVVSKVFRDHLQYKDVLTALKMSLKRLNINYLIYI